MNDPVRGKRVSAVFITFSGNCRKALTYYQTCFGGVLEFETFELEGFPEMPVISGSLISDNLIIYGSDLVHNEGRILGNYMAVFLHCKNAGERQALIQKLRFNHPYPFSSSADAPRLVEITDAFDVRWVLGV